MVVVERPKAEQWIRCGRRLTESGMGDWLG